MAISLVSSLELRLICSGQRVIRGSLIPHRCISVEVWRRFVTDLDFLSPVAEHIAAYVQLARWGCPVVRRRSPCFALSFDYVRESRFKKDREYFYRKVWLYLTWRWSSAASGSLTASFGIVEVGRNRVIGLYAENAFIGNECVSAEAGYALMKQVNRAYKKPSHYAIIIGSVMTKIGS